MDSIRILSDRTGATVSTVLPPPTASLKTRVKAAIYSRMYNLVYVLINSRELWIYTTRSLVYSLRTIDCDIHGYTGLTHLVVLMCGMAKCWTICLRTNTNG